MKAVMWTDTVQVIIMFISVAVVIVCLKIKQEMLYR